MGAPCFDREECRRCYFAEEDRGEWFCKALRDTDFPGRRCPFGKAEDDSLPFVLIEEEEK